MIGRSPQGGRNRCKRCGSVGDNTKRGCNDGLRKPYRCQTLTIYPNIFRPKQKHDGCCSSPAPFWRLTSEILIREIESREQPIEFIEIMLHSIQRLTNRDTTVSAY